MKKFRDMTDSEKLEIINAAQNGFPLEVCEYEAGEWTQARKFAPIIGFEYFYRIPKRPMSVDWSVLKDEYICAARNVSDNAYAYTHSPEDANTYWSSKELVSVRIGQLKSYDPGTVDWKDSLIWRPGYGDKK